MITSVFFLASFIKEQLTPKWLREVRDISKYVVFANQEAHLQDFARDVKCKKVQLKTESCISCFLFLVFLTVVVVRYHVAAHVKLQLEQHK